MQAWERFLNRLQHALGKETVDKWLRSLKVLHFDAGNLYLEAADTFQASWFEEHIRARIRTEFINNNHRSIKVHLTVAHNSSTPPASYKKKNQPPPPPALHFSSSELNPLSTLQDFVVDQGNELAYKLICEQITTKRSPTTSSLNPFFLYGGSGSGKTHLLMAIAHLLKQQGKTPFFVHAETFTEHVVSAIRGGGMQQLRNAYRNVPALLIDDVHLLASRNATQEEFFHLFNTLHMSGRQIILSANQPPQQLKEIESRLISRFEWGILLPLAPLGPLKLREMIEKRALALRLPLGEVEIDFLLEAFHHHHAGVQRALEALVLRRHMKGPSSSTLTISEIKELLSDLIEAQKEEILTPDKIVRCVAKHYGVRCDDVTGDSQSREFALPRKMAMYLCRAELKLPFSKIGALFDRDHSTVMSSIKQVQEKLGTKEAEMAKTLKLLQEMVRQKG